MKASEFNISKEKFVLVNENKRLKDKELVTKPVSYFQDALRRFARNKGSIVAAAVIGVLFLYAIIAPMVSQYKVSDADPVYSYVLPKSHITQNLNFLDGCSEKTLNEVTFVYYASMGTETGHPAIKNNKYKQSSFYNSS